MDDRISTPFGPVSQWLADLGVAYRVMLTASIGGLLWLAATHLTGMNHDTALLLSLAAGLGAFARAHQLASRATAARTEDTTDESKEVKP